MRFKQFTIPQNALAKESILNYCFYITKFKYHLCYYLNLFAILAKGTVRWNHSDITLTDRTDCTDFFAHATCFSTTEMTDLTDFVSIACSLRY